MTGPVPQVGVKLVAQDEGVAQAIRELVTQLRGLNREAAQSEQAARRSARGFDAMARSIADIGTVIGAAKLTGFVKDVVNAGDQIEKLAQKTGASAETLSALAVAGATSEVSLDTLERVLRSLSLSLTGLRGGSSEAVQAFRAIGLSAKDLDGLSTDQAIRRIFDALSQLPAGTAKAAAAMKIFGKSGADIIPLLDQLGKDGIGGATAKAKEFGLLLDAETTRSAAEFNDSLTNLKLAGAGVAAEFAKGVIPTLTTLATETSHVIASLPPGVKALVGNLVAMETAVIGLVAALRLLKALQLATLLSNPFALAAVGIAAAAAALVTFADSAGRAKREYEGFLGTLTTDAAISTERTRLQLAIQNKQAELDASNSTFHRLALLKQIQQLKGQLQQLDERAKTLNANGGGDNAPDDALLKAQLQARQSAARDELQLAEAKNKAEQQLNQEQYDKALESLDLYYKRRLGLTRESVEAEIKALQLQRAALVATPATTPAEGVQRQSQIEGIDRQIEQKRTEGETQERQIIEDRRNAEKALATERLGYEQKVQEAKGQTLAVALAAIDREAVEFRKSLAHEGVSGSAQDAAVTSFTSALRAKAQFDDVQRQVTQVFAEIERERTRIAAEVQIGVVTELQGQQQIAAVESGRLPVLQSLVDQGTALARSLGNPELLATTQDWNTQLVTLAASANLAAQEAARFKSSLQDAVQSDLSTFLGQTITDVDSLGDAFLSLAESVVDSIRRIVSELIAAKVVGGLSQVLGLGVSIATAGGSGGSGGSGAAHDFAETISFAEGGYTGPGGKYEAAGIVHAGEFVVNASQTSAHRGLLEAINAGGFTFTAMRSYAEGGFVAGLAGETMVAGRVDGRIEVAAAPGTTARVVDGDILRVVRDNPRAMKQALGIRD